MDAALLSSIFIEATIPFGVTFNQFGVAQKGLRQTFKFQKLSVMFDICALNGLWGGVTHIHTNLWGCSGPISRNHSFRFSSFEECVKHLWWESFIQIGNNKENIQKEFIRFKSEMDIWLTLSPEEKFNLFKEVDFYGS